MKHLILIPATFISTLLCFALAGMWVRSRYVGDGWSFVGANGRTRQVISYAGGLHFYEATPSAAPMATSTTRPSRSRMREAVPAGARWSTRYPISSSSITWDAAGFGMTTGEHTMSGSFTLGPKKSFTVPNSHVGGGIPYTITFPAGSGPSYTARGAAYLGGRYDYDGMGTRISLYGSGSFDDVPAPAPPPPASRPARVDDSFVEGHGSMPLNGTIWITVHRFAAVVVPYWALMLLTALLPAAPLRKLPRHLRNRRRRRLGLCETCAYDLRASKDRCPECGTPIPEA